MPLSFLLPLNCPLVENTWLPKALASLQVYKVDKLNNLASVLY